MDLVTLLYIDFLSEQKIMVLFKRSFVSDRMSVSLIGRGFEFIGMMAVTKSNGLIEFIWF